MSPKPKQTGKKLSLNREQNSKAMNSTLSTISTESTTRSGLPPEAEDRFELELLWCIQQLQSLLIDGKMSEKQIYVASKNLHTLKSDSASLIKKRQIMRNTFGDYRAKMVEDEKKFKKTNSTIKFTPAVPPNTNSLFVKKAFRNHDGPIVPEAHTNETDNSANTVNKLSINGVLSNETFKFNFACPEN